MRDRPLGLYSCQSIAVLLPTRRLVSSASEQGWPSPPALSPLPRACRVVIARNMGLPRALCRSRPGEVFQHRVARRLAAEAHSAWCGCRNQPQLCRRCLQIPIQRPWPSGDTAAWEVDLLSFLHIFSAAETNQNGVPKGRHLHLLDFGANLR